MPFHHAEVYAGMPEEDLNLIMYGIVAEHEEDLIMLYETEPENNAIVDLMYMADVYEITYGVRQ